MQDLPYLHTSELQQAPSKLVHGTYISPVTPVNATPNSATWSSKVLNLERHANFRPTQPFSALAEVSVTAELLGIVVPKFPSQLRRPSLARRGT